MVGEFEMGLLEFNKMFEVQKAGGLITIAGPITCLTNLI